MTERRLPPPLLLGAVRGDLTPVRPYLPPLLRTLMLAPAGFALLVGIPVLWSPRPNLALLGGLAGWGLSALQTMVGLVVVGLALREAVPGRELSRRALGALVLAAMFVFLGLTVTSQWLAPVALRRKVWAAEALGCFRMAATWGVPALGVAGSLVVRAAATRPVIAGAASGLGVGLMADAGMRLFCGISTISHVVIGHGAAILLLTALGALAAALADRVR